MPKMTEEEFLDTPIPALTQHGLPLRIINLLEKNRGWMTLRDLKGVTAEQIEAIPNLGPESVNSLRSALVRYYFISFPNIGQEEE